MKVEEVRSRLAGTRFAAVDRVERTGSTNADLLAAARTGSGERVLVADHQEAGRGRLDRRWEAPPGASLLMSVLVRPPFPAFGPHLLSTALGVATVDALRSLAGVSVGLKWPNDVVAPGAGVDGSDLKLGGMLAEFISGEGGEAVVLGIGVNLTWREVGFPPELASTATSVDLLGGALDRADLVVGLLRLLDLTGDLASSAVACELVVDSYRDRCVTLGRRVRIERPDNEVTGHAVAVQLDGSLVVRDDNGVDHVVTVGDVVHLRPA